MAHFFPPHNREDYSLCLCAVNKQDRLRYAEFCLRCTRPPLWPAPLPPLCFLEYLEWVLYEKAYLKKDLRDPWLSPTAAQLCPLSPTPNPLNCNHSPKPWHHSRNAYNSASSYCTAVMKGAFFWVLRVMWGSVFNLCEVTGSVSYKYTLTLSVCCCC